MPEPDPRTLPEIRRNDGQMTELQGHLLAVMLLDIRDHDPSRLGSALPQTDEAYARRNDMIYQAVATARAAGLMANVAPDASDPRWCIAYIELPEEGQVSWHVPAHPARWDGHTTEEKYARCGVFYGRVAP